MQYGGLNNDYVEDPFLSMKAPMLPPRTLVREVPLLRGLQPPNLMTDILASIKPERTRTKLALVL